MAEQTDEMLRDPTAVLPYEVSLIIFSFVPPQDLVNNCVLVCQYWKRLSDDQTTWRLICERTRRFRREYMKSFEPEDWKKFYYTNPYSRNLLNNANLSDAHPHITIKSTEQKSHILASWHGFSNLTADEWAIQFSPWEMRELGGDGIQLECPPIGCRDLPPGIGPVCIATSYRPTKRLQIIDLVAEGVSEYVLDECNLPIHIYEWFNGRFDCGCEYYIKISLRNGRQDKFKGWKVKVEGKKPEGRHEWEKLEHVFCDYPPGVRYIYFEDYGRDTKYWSGHYGAKLAGATVKFFC